MRREQHAGSRGAAALRVPSLFWLGVSDGALPAGAWAGVALAAVVVAGFANTPLLLLLWAL